MFTRSPSIAIVKSEVDDPWLVRLYCPSTNGVTVVPGMSSALAVVSRRVVGIASSTSRLATKVETLLITSTVGASAVTVSTSASEPTSSCALIVGVKFPCSAMLPRRTVLNPASVNVTS